MTAPFEPGDFVWTNFPFEADPNHPGPGRHAALVMAAIIVVPQIIVAVAAPWVGHYAEQWGRRPVLLIARSKSARATPRIMIEPRLNFVPADSNGSSAASIFASRSL